MTEVSKERVLIFVPLRVNLDRCAGKDINKMFDVDVHNEH